MRNTSLWAVLGIAFLALPGTAADDPRPQPSVEQELPEAGSKLVKLAKDYDVWIDPVRKLVVVDGEVAMREGPLEMFACPKLTKEHESAVTVNCKAQFIHAGLLAVGVEPGHPVKFDPEYVAAAGPIVDIWVLWEDDKGRHKMRAQEWIKDNKTGEAMKHDWVFGGSTFWTDDSTGEKHYSADAGDFICVSNFSTAMLDLPVQSSQANDALLFTAFTENIPPRGTKVRLVLMPRLTKKTEAPAKTDSEPKPVNSNSNRVENQ